MRSRKLLSFGVVTLGLAVTAAYAAPAQGLGTTKSSVRPVGGHGHPTLPHCDFQQGYTPADPADSVIAQNFETSMDSQDSVAADDFTVPVTCKAIRFWVDGHYSSGLPCAVGGPVWPAPPACVQSMNFIFYKDTHGRPGPVVKACMNQSYTDDSPPESPGPPFHYWLGNMRTNFQSTGCAPNGIKFNAGTLYWVSMQVNMDYSAGGYWQWDTRPLFEWDHEALWENPLDGWGTGCTSWHTLAVCWPNINGFDFGFRVYYS